MTQSINSHISFEESNKRTTFSSKRWGYTAHAIQQRIVSESIEEPCQLAGENSSGSIIPLNTSSHRARKLRPVIKLVPLNYFSRLNTRGFPSATCPFQAKLLDIGNPTGMIAQANRKFDRVTISLLLADVAGWC